MADGYVLHTDQRWLQYQAGHREGAAVAFARGPDGWLRQLRPGGLLIFIAAGLVPHRAAGIATFIRNNVATLGDAWETYGAALGARTFDDLIELVPLRAPTVQSQVAVLEGGAFRSIVPPITLADLGVVDKQRATRGWNLSTADMETAVARVQAERESPTDIEPAFSEGDPILVTHLRRERNRYLVARAKHRWHEDNPALPCEVCGFSFHKRYGDLGLQFIEAHHRLPLSEGQHAERRITRITDLAPVCANCHRMLHTRPNLTIDELRQRLQDRA